MNDASKVKPSHIQRAAFIYIRQSSPAQVEYNRESTARQYALVEKACQLGWAKEQVIVIDEDLGVSGSGFAERSGLGFLDLSFPYTRDYGGTFLLCHKDRGTANISSGTGHQQSATLLSV